MNSLPTWIGIGVTVLGSLIVPACRDYLDLRSQVAVMKMQQQYLHGDVHVPLGASK